MDHIQDLTLGEVARRLKKCGGTLQLNYSEGVYHAYVHDQVRLGSYSRGDLEEAVSGAVSEAETKHG